MNRGIKRNNLMKEMRDVDRGGELLVDIGIVGNQNVFTHEAQSVE
jgi:hypothetical protein